MNFFGRQTWWPLVGVPWALLVGLVLAPAPAWAQCGHYVLIGDRSMTDAHRADAQAASGSKSTSPLIPMPGHMPCSGPGCKQGPAKPPLAPVAPPPVVEKEWGHVAGLSLPWGQELHSLLRDSTWQRPLHHAGTIYHPPRLSLS